MGAEHLSECYCSFRAQFRSQDATVGQQSPPLPLARSLWVAPIYEFQGAGHHGGGCCQVASGVHKFPSRFYASARSHALTRVRVCVETDFLCAETGVR